MSQPSYQKTISVKTTAASSTSYVALPANSASLTLAGDLLDDTDFTSTGFRSRVVGLRDWNASVTILWDGASTITDVVRDAWLNASRLDIKYLPNGTKGFAGTAYVETFSLSGDVGGLEQVDVTFQPNSALSTA